MRLLLKGKYARGFSGDSKWLLLILGRPLVELFFNRYQWYQSEDCITIDVFVKNIVKESVECAADGNNSFTIAFKTNDEKVYEKTFEFKHSVAKPSFTVGAAKMEIRLVKGEPVLWSGLLVDKDAARTDSLSDEAPPAYPSSSCRPVNWDLIDVLEDDEQSNVDTFFKKIYANAGEDAKRAMMKSFVESGGTVLSTDWSDVGSKQVDPSPPEGMVAKKF